MSDNYRKEKGFRHNVEEPLKRKGIRARCRRAVERIGDPDTMLESHRKEMGFRRDPESRWKDKGSGHDAVEPLKR